jgi:hypothetical protein
LITLDAYYTSGYYIGAAIFIGLFALVYWFAGRLGWFGLLVRLICAVLIAFKLYQVVFTHP